MPAISAIVPATVTNDQPTTLTLTGTGFVAGMGAAVGEQALSDVRVQSATTLTGTLATGLCPGIYAATVSDAHGKPVSGGVLAVTGVRDVTFAGTSAGQTARRTGATQQMTMPLPDVLITDTTCGEGNWSLAISIIVPTDASGRGEAFTPQSFRLESPGSAAPVVTLLAVDRGQATATVSLPRTDARSGVGFRAAIGGDIPADAPVGHYTLQVAVTFAEG